MRTFQQRVEQFCASHRLRPDKDLGQHFLTDEAVLEAIVDAAAIQPTDHVVEIGPGIGVLTERLLEKAKRVTAIELDARLIPLLRDFLGENPKFSANNSLTVIHGNALHVDFPTEPYAIVANIPYHITSPLLRHAFLESPIAPTAMTLLIQREVAEKICDERSRGVLTILVGLFGRPSIVRRVPPSAFLPPPAVDSAVLRVECFGQPLADAATIEQIFRLTKIGFGQKRKMLRNSLGSIEGGMETLARAGIDPTRRPETLTIEEWTALAQAFQSRVERL